MYYAASYHFTLYDSNSNIKSFETWVVSKDTLENRLKTRKWFKKFIKLAECEYIGFAYEKFISELVESDVSFNRINDGTLVIDVRYHYD